MTPEDVYKYYGSRYNFAKKTGMSHSTLSNWMKWGYVPIESQYKVERLTKSALKVEWIEKNE